MKKESKEIRTYSECNYEVVIPGLKIGLTDLVLIAGILTVSLLGLYIFQYVSLAIAGVLLLVGVGISLFLFMYARSMYHKTGRVNVIYEWYVYVFDPEIFKGRDDHEK